MNVLALPAFSDNYIWMLHDGFRAAVVDPGDAGPVQQTLARLRLELHAILVTHHHPDHVGGVDALRPVLKGPVYGPARESIPAPFQALREGDQIEILGESVQVIDVPGHTAGHIAYVMQSQGAEPLLFCGDTLFSAGCGRLFEGTPSQMLASLDKLAALPPNTRVYCTHEYTLSNLRFAKAVEPDNMAIDEAITQCTELRARGDITLPSSLAREARINPFLRCDQPAVVSQARSHGARDESRVAVFAALREWKNRFT